MLKEYLNESLTSKIYRMESFKNFCNTILDNKFYTSLSEMVYGEQPFKNNRSYYLSFMRTRKNFFSGDAANLLSFAVITIDGNKLNNRFKSVPIDYWQSGPLKSESEDRIVTNKPYIENAMSYMTHIDFCLKYPYMNWKFPKVAEALKQNGISFDVYTDSEACLLRDKKQIIDIDYEKFAEQKGDNPRNYYEAAEELRSDLKLIELMLDYYLFGRRKNEFEDAKKNATMYQTGLLKMFDREEFTSDDFSRIRTPIISSTRYKELKEDVDSLIRFLRNNRIRNEEDINRLKNKK